MRLLFLRPRPRRRTMVLVALVAFILGVAVGAAGGPMP